MDSAGALYSESLSKKRGQKKCSNGVIMLDTTIKSRCQWNPVSGHQQATKIWPY